jgi:hypothetical protein
MRAMSHAPFPFCFVIFQRVQLFCQVPASNEDPLTSGLLA